MTVTICDNEWRGCEKEDRKPTKQPQEADQLVVMRLRNVTAPGGITHLQHNMVLIV